MVEATSVDGGDVTAASKAASAAQRAKAAAGGSPRPVIRGESPMSRAGAIVDWLTFSFLPVGSTADATAQLMNYLRLWFGMPIAAKPSIKGFRGYSSSLDVNAFVDGEWIRLAIIASGGANVGGTMLVDMSGMGCSIVDDWDAVYATLQDLNAKITRVDLAIDLLQGEATIDQIDDMYFAGEFNSGGRIPKRRYIESGDSRSAESGGCTLEIGKRENGKLVRAYEKGRQLGKQDSAWLRIEVELRSRDRVIPHDVVLKRNEYFSGAHKALASFLDAAAQKIKTLQKQHEHTLDKSVEHVRFQYGKVVEQLCIKHDENLAAVIAEIRVKGIPAKLQKSALARHVYGSHVPEPLYEGS